MSYHTRPGLETSGAANDPATTSVPGCSIRQLQYIVAVADLGGFRRAAEACHVSQPSLSAQVAYAEGALGVQIFERDRRRARVSRAGALVVEHARRVLLAMRDLQDAARQAGDPFRGTLRVGVIPTVCPYLLPEVAGPLAHAYPHLTVLWSEEKTRRLVGQLNDGALDAAIVAAEADLGGLEHTVVGRDAFVLAAPHGHPLVRGRGPARADALKGARVLLLEDGHCFRDQALAWCANAGAAAAGLRATSLATLVQMVDATAGVTLLPALAVPVENRGRRLAVRPFAEPGPARTLAVAWRKGSALRMPLAAVAGVIREALLQRAPSARAPHRDPRACEDTGASQTRTALRTG
jgi:LysR family hydrogen peroxide-inducible transcriptional activator